MSDAEILTTAPIAARYIYGNIASAMLSMKELQGVAMMISPALFEGCMAYDKLCRLLCRYYRLQGTEGGELFTDAGYTDYEQEGLYQNL